MSNNKLNCISDRVRLMYLKFPIDVLDDDLLEYPRYNQIVQDNDYTYVAETPLYKVMTELWSKQCLDRFYKKYNCKDIEGFKKHMVPRLHKIGEFDNLKLDEYRVERSNSWEGNFEYITLAIFKKQIVNLLP